jgi:thiol-disulfide isomerase/thioredoxin
VLSKTSNRRITNAHIQVVDLQNPQASEATLTAETDRDGFFMIRGLQKGRNYQLIARARDDGRILAGAEMAKPPNPKVCILVVEDTNSPINPNDPLFNQPVLPGQRPLNVGEGSSPSRPGGPAAFLDSPVPLQSGTALPPYPASPDSGRQDPPVRPEGIADRGPNQDGFQKAVPANIPAVPPILPPPPGSPTSIQAPPPPPLVKPVSDGPGSTGWSDEAVPVPWCVLHGRQLKNLALYGLDNQAWEFRRHRKGRVVLLDFWSTTCTPCLQSIPHLCDLQGSFGQYGLEVIGIAYETGTFPEQAQKVKNTRARLLMNYTTLLGGGGRGDCPVKTQFQITRLPTLILLNENSEVVWRDTGLPTAEKLRELRYEIARQLRVRMPNTP